MIFAGALVGAGMGFLWFNTYPAQIFMGDVGALALGAALGVMAVIARHEIILFIMGGVFVVEAFLSSFRSLLQIDRSARISNGASASPF